MLADNQANCDKFHNKAALTKIGIERGMVDQAGVIRSLNEGDKVTFTLEDDRRGRGKQAGQIEKA
jgi:hypothetical protein